MTVQIKTSLVVAVMALALALPALAEGKEKEGKQEEEIKLADCPAAVQQTIKDNAGTGQIGDVEKTTKKDGTVVYEADVKKDGKKSEIKVAADGKLIKVSAADEEEEEDEAKEKK